MRRSALWLGSLAALVWTETSAAQVPEVPQVISPLRVETDHNNVNLVSGKTTIEPPVLSVPAAPNLRFDRVQNAAPYVVGRVAQSDPGESRRESYSIHAGGAASESFTCIDGDCTSVTGTGSTFIPNSRVYRQAGSGARWQFTELHFHDPVTPGVDRKLQYYALGVSYPNGETISYAYDKATGGAFGYTFYRPNRIGSNLGYHIAISYQSDDFNSDHWGAPREATLYETASNAVLGRLTYGLDGTAITQYGDGLQNPRTYSCANCRTSMGASIEVAEGSLTLPGESAPALQVTRLSPPPGLPGAELVGAVARDGVTWNYAYGNLRLDYQSGNLWYDSLTVTGPNGFRNVYEFTRSDRRNVMTRMTDSLNRVTSFTFDGAYRPTRIVHPELNEAGVAYDELGNVTVGTATPRPGSGGLAPIDRRAEYPGDSCLPSAASTACYRPIWSRDGMGRQTDYRYNGSGQLTEQTEPAINGVSRRTFIEYTASPFQPPNRQISRRSRVTVCAVTSPPGSGLATCNASQSIVTEYDYFGNTLLVTAERRIDPATGTTLTTTNGYDAQGRLVSSDGPLPGTADATYNRYDAHGRRTWEIGPADGNGVRTATRTTFRPSDDKVLYAESGTIPDPNSTNLIVLRRTDFAYDARRNPERQSVSATGTTYALTQRRFDLSNRLECEALRMNPALFASPPADPCLPGPEGQGLNAFGPDRITRNVYDNAGQRLQHRVGVGYPAIEAAEATWEYNGNGQVTAVIDGNGTRAELRYDGHMRQDRWTFPSANGPPGTVNALDYEEYGYDAAGNRTSYRKRDGSILSYQYDNLNRMILKIVPERAGLGAGHSRDVYYGYDLRDLQLYARFDSHAGPGISNARDAFGRLESSVNSTDGFVRVLTYQHREDGARTRITHPDGQWFGTSWDAAGRPYFLSSTGGTGIAFAEYAPHGAPSALHRVNAATGLGYDAMQRPSARGHYFFGGGGAGTALWSYGYNPASGISSVTRDNPAYAWNGHYAVNRAYTTNGLNQYTQAGGAAFTYHLNGNLLTTPGPNGTTIAYTYDVENRLVGTSGGVQLAYDPLGRLMWSTAAGAFTRYLHDGDALVAEYDWAGNLTRRHVHWPGADLPMATYEYGSGGATMRQLFSDHQGSIVAIADGAGAVTAINRYDEYGIPAAGNQGRFQYTGQIWLSELGMYYYKARIYSPTLGRFLQTDPIGYDDQFNLYAYVGNDPVNRADPTGMSSICTGSRIGCGDENGGLCMTCSGFGGLGYPSTARGPRTALAAGMDASGGGSATGLPLVPDLTILAEIADRAYTFREIGIEGELAAENYLRSRGYQILATHLYVVTPFGTRIIDIVARSPSGHDVAYEVKANNATRSRYQRTQDYIIRVYGGEIRTEGNRFFSQGSRIQISTGQLNVTCRIGCEIP